MWRMPTCTKGVLVYISYAANVKGTVNVLVDLQPDLPEAETEFGPLKTQPSIVMIIIIMSRNYFKLHHIEWTVGNRGQIRELSFDFLVIVKLSHR